MLTHDIIITKSEPVKHGFESDGYWSHGVFYPYQQRHRHHQYSGYSPQTSSYGAGYTARYKEKHAYNLYIKNLFVKKGEYITKRYNNNWPYKPEDIYRVLDIQEMHTLVEFAPDGMPKCLWCVNHDGVGEWRSTDDIIRVYKLPDGCPEIPMEGENGNA